MPWVTVDGALGEGGGQVVRTSLTCALLTGTPVRVVNIRAKRPRPGLRPQHVAAVRAAADISHARVDGDAVGSQELTFCPGNVRPGRYRWDIRTAGAVTLVLQTVVLPLAFADGPSHVVIRGGTHVPWSPTWAYVERQWAPYMEELGLSMRLRLKRAGFYPQGGGEVHVAIRPTTRPLRSLNTPDGGILCRVEGAVYIAHLPDHVARRQKLTALNALRSYDWDARVIVRRLEAPSPGTLTLVEAHKAHGRGCYTALGERGKRAEVVAQEAVELLNSYVESRAAVDRYLADQLLLPLALAEAPSTFSTECITTHLVTNARLVTRLLSAEVHVEGDEGAPGRVLVVPCPH
ncbi:MAG: RNA 3'-terminal phosphate cyclase [Ardenticatenia bacterium]|nr:RNA 3'-terminal phosphate cyclase [Ardenticatenia bacterium]